MSTTLRRALYGLAFLAGVSPALAAGPGVFKFDELTFEVSESAGRALILVERSNGEDGAVSVQYSTADGTATAGQDYTAVSGTLSWSAGDESDRTIEVPISDDSTAEGLETILLRLANPTGGATLDAERGSSTLRILANDGGSGGGGGGGGDDGGGDDNGGSRPGELKFDQADFQGLEGRSALITVERSRGELGAVSVSYATAPGTATAGSDYTAVSGVLSWGPGDGSRKTFQVPVLADDVADGGESIRLVLSNPTGGAALGERPTAMLTLVDGAGGGGGGGGSNGSRPGTIKFGERSFQVIEGAGTARIAIERSQGERGTVSVRYTAAAGSAAEGQDFTAVTGILSWGNNDGRTQFVDIPVLDDSAFEGNETVQLTLSEVTGGAAIDTARGTSTLVILDDDGATTACVGDDDTSCLSDDRFRVEVVWRTPQGETGSGHMRPLSADSATVWFFQPENAEMLVKVLNACGPFDRYWVFFAATTDVDYTVTVTDTRTGVVRQYTNPAGQAAQPVQDTVSFQTCGG
jgi:hypothetical protein